MAHLGVASVLIALLASTPPVNTLQNREPPPPGGFAIQVTNQSGQSSHFPFAKGGLKGGGSFTLPPGEIVRRADKDSEQVSEIFVTASYEGDVWKIEVSVVKGEFYDKGRQDVAKYLVLEGEKATVREMEQFGVRPFEVAVVRVSQAAASQPEVRNRTESIVVTNVEATVVPAPYRISLRNLSSKSVLALELNTYSGEQRLVLKWPQGTWERPLIEPGGTHVEDMWSPGRGQATPFDWVPEQSTSVEVSTVVFADGTYEGNPYLAAVTRAQAAGSKAQLRRVLPLLQAARESTAGTDENTLAGLKQAVSLLGEDVDPDRLKEVQEQFPTLDEGGKRNMANFMRAGLHGVKAALLKETEAFEKAGQPQSGISLREWLSKTEERCERWLAAL